MCDKDPGASFSRLPVQSRSPCSLPPLPEPVEAAGMTDDITQQGFSRRYHHGEGISMETFSPLSPHRFMILLHPNLLKGPSDGRDRDTVQAPGINCVLVLYHLYSSHDAFHLLPLFSSVLALKTQPFHHSDLLIWKQMPCRVWKKVEKVKSSNSTVCAILPLLRKLKLSFFLNLYLLLILIDVYLCVR